MTQNAIEFYSDENEAFGMLYPGPFLDLFRELARDFPERVRLREQTGGCVFVRFPLSWLKIEPDETPAAFMLHADEEVQRAIRANKAMAAKSCRMKGRKNEKR